MAQFISTQLEKNDKKVRWYHEGLDDHLFWNNFGDLFDNDLFKDEVSIEQFQQINLKLWQDLVKTAQTEDTVFVFDGYFFASMTNLLFRSDLEVSKITAFYRQVEEIVRSLNPLLVYYYTENIRGHTIATWDDRARWAKESAIKNAEKTPHVIRSGLKGEDALVYYIEQIWKLDNKIFSLTQINKLSICIDKKDYKKYRRQVIECLGLKYFTDELFIADNTKYCGIYDNDKENLIVKLLNDELVCDWGQKNMALLPVEANIYNLRSYPIYLKFIEDAEGMITNIETYGNQLFNRAGLRFKRVLESKHSLLD